jgi:glycosyltransferase involved in cell wall biosynthesis
MVDVSVLITCFEKEKYLSECVNSITRQTKLPKEIIIVHDGCSEPMAHAKADTIIFKENRGIVTARDEAFRYSRGKLVLFVDGDDIISPDYIEKMCLALAEGADISYPDIFHWADLNSKLTVTPNQITPQFVKDFQRVVIPVTCLMGREVYEKLGGFREFLVLEDLDFWIRALCKGYTFKKAETLLWYRHYPGTRNSMEMSKKKDIMQKILDQFTFEEDKVYVKTQ